MRKGRAPGVGGGVVQTHGEKRAAGVGGAPGLGPRSGQNPEPFLIKAS